jgi:hypothetical protein
MTDLEMQDGDEISIRAVLARIWRGRALIVSLVVLAVLAAGSYVAFDALTASRPVTYLVNLRSIENGKYPNGAQFSPQDLLIPEVLAEIGSQFDLPGNAPLRQSISVAFDSPTAAGLARRYRDQLAARNLTQADITAINASYEQQLAAATRSSLRINLDYQELGVSDDVGVAIARALPAAWTKVYTTQFRILLDTRLADLSVASRTEDLGSTVSILAANDQLQVMRDGLELLIGDNRLALIRTKAGVSPADLRKELARFERDYFNLIRVAAFGGEDAVAKAYLTDLRLTVADLRRQIEAYNRTLAELRDYQQSGRKLSAADTSANERASVELGETSLSGIVDLAERASFASFVQETLRSRNGLEFRVSQVMRELELAASGGTLADAPTYREAAAEGLAELTASYRELVATAETMLLDRTDSLYEPVLGPLVERSLVSPRSLLVVAAAGMAALFLGLMIIFLGAVANRSRREPAAS